VPKVRLTPLTWIFAAFIALALTEYQVQLLLPLERRLSDLFVRLQARSVQPDPDIVVVGVDDHSLERMAGPELAIDRWPWPRAVHGELVAGIAAQNPRAIVFDIFFSERDRTRPESDDLFNDLVAPVTNVYFPTVRLDKAGDQFGVLLRDMAKPLGMLYGRDAELNAHANVLPPLALRLENWRLGIINLDPDSDGVARRYYLYMPVSGWKIPSLPARVASDLGYKIPDQESLLLGWSAMTRKHVSYVDLYEDFNREKRLRDPAEFKDKIVIVGTDATGLGDLRASPVNPFHPGVEILATAIENLKRGTWMRAAPGAVPLGAALVLMTLVFLVYRQGKYKLLTIGAVVLIVCLLLLGASYVAIGQRVVLPLFTPIAFGVTLYFAFALHEYLHERRERLKAVDYFSRFVNPQVVKDLLAHGGLSKKGESREITVLFSDIRGFTRLSETRSPEEVVALLNRYFSRQVDVIFRHGGCLDKFIGDAIMAFWGAPLDDPDHAKHAVMAALEMGETLEQFKLDLGELGTTFDVGIGLNSGPAVVGLIGSENKREYTAIGDTVNLGSRIEGLTKGVARILVSEETMQRCAGVFDFVDRGFYKVKGREKDVRLFEPKRKPS
jgi:adenylate cyclase